MSNGSETQRSLRSYYEASSYGVARTVAFGDAEIPLIVDTSQP